jgi:hypothetical protein
MPDEGRKNVWASFTANVSAVDNAINDLAKPYTFVHGFCVNARL